MTPAVEEIAAMLQHAERACAATDDRKREGRYGVCIHCADTIDALTAAIRERDAPLLAMLKRLQWLPDSVGYLRCPECFGHAFHEAGCALCALLEEAGK